MRYWLERLRGFSPRLLDFYIARQLLTPIAIVLVTFASMLLVQLLLRDARTIFADTSTPLAALQYVLYRIPWFLVLSLPVAVTGGTALTLARLIRDRELVAISMGAISLTRLAAPILALAGLVAVVCFLTNEKVVPWANAGALTAQGRALYYRPYSEMRTSRLVFEGKDGWFFYVRLLDVNAGRARDIVCFQVGPDGSPRSALVSPVATFRGKTWRLLDVKEHSFDPSGHVKEGITHHDEMTLQLQEDVQTALAMPTPVEQMSALELRQRISALSSGGVEGAQQLTLDFHRRFSVPAACIILAALMIPLSVRFAGGNIFNSLLLAVFIYFLYNGLMNWAKAVAEAGLMNPVLAAWLHDVVFGAAALLLFIRRR